HRKLAQVQSAARGESIAHFAQARKVRPGVLGVWRRRRYRHQPGDLNLLADSRDQSLGIARRDSALARLRTEINFEQYAGARYGVYFVQCLREPHAIKAVNQFEHRGRGSRLVALQVANQVPSKLS